MRANHLVTFGLCIGTAATAAWFAGCGTDIAGTCSDTNTCGPVQGDASTDQASGEDAGDGGPGDDGSDGSGGMDAEGGAACDGGGQIVCNGVCVSANDPSHCGSCTHACVGPDGGAGQATCTNGVCGVGCTAPTSLDCNGSCVDPSDPAHCGSCTNACPGPDAGTGSAQCTLGADGGGVCSVQCGGSTSEQCGDSCYDPTDVHHCGSCSNDCPVPTNGTATCGGSPPNCGIACSSGYHACNGACDPDGDVPSNTSDPCILSDVFGVFVSASTGSDTSGNGTAAAPWASIGHALSNLGSKGRVYVCNGTYDEQVSVTGAVGLFGGLSCTAGSWSYVGNHALVVGPQNQPALVVNAGSAAVDIEDMAFTAPDASGKDSAGNGQSSIAALVNGSSNVTMHRCALTAGAAVQGQDRSQAAAYGSSAPSGNPGSASVSAGGTGAGGLAEPNPQCTTSVGGAGGSAKSGEPASDLDGQSGQPGPNNAGTSADCNLVPSQGGGKGADGASGAPGAGAPNWATFSGGAWTPTAGQQAGPGSVGQGGGGGGAGAAANVIGGAGGGGAGGCGGSGGLGGGGGGSSIAVLAYNASLVIDSSALTAANAGPGGNGAPGQSGQLGGSGGTAGSSSCNGGSGGNGGAGGPGGGGAGGLSAGVVWFGTAPTLDSSTQSGIVFGAAGGGGKDGNGTTTNGGKPGTAAAIVQFQ